MVFPSERFSFADIMPQHQDQPPANKKRPSKRQREALAAAAAVASSSTKEDVKEEDSLKVFVSRLPESWRDEDVRKVLSAFGRVVEATVALEEDGVTSRKFAFATFESEEARSSACEARVLKGSRGNTWYAIRVAQVDRNEDNLCRLWRRGICQHGDRCKFKHEGPGACAENAGKGTSQSTPKKKKCLSFSSKGKCSRGESCQFLHDISSIKRRKKVDQTAMTNETTLVGNA